MNKKWDLLKVLLVGICIFIITHLIGPIFNHHIILTVEKLTIRDFPFIQLFFTLPLLISFYIGNKQYAPRKYTLLRQVPLYSFAISFLICLSLVASIFIFKIGESDQLFFLFLFIIIYPISILIISFILSLFILIINPTRTLITIIFLTFIFITITYLILVDIICKPSDISCYVKKAYRQNDHSICQKSQPPLECYQKLSILKRDVSICLNSQREVDTYCYLYYAEGTNDPSVCLQIRINKQLINSEKDREYCCRKVYKLGSDQSLTSDQKTTCGLQ